MKSVLITLLCIFFLSCSSDGTGQNSGETGSFIFTPSGPLSSKPIEVFYHIPSSGDSSTMPILISLHGASRNASEYRDYWISMANANGFMVYAPEFSSANYPGGDSYNLANIFDDGDNPSTATLNPQNEWTFSILDPLFEYIKADVSGTQENYSAWGHSAGAQFLHRFVLYMPNSKLNLAICSNAGWYTVPEYGINFPYGLDMSELPTSDLTDALSKKLIIHLAQNDTDPNSPGLRHNTVVDNQQGLHRLIRGQYFATISQETAEDLDVTYNWEKHEVPNVGHEAQLMANDALQFVIQNSLATGNINMLENLRIYPNPASHDWFLTYRNTIITSVEIFSLLGEKIFSKNYHSNQVNIPTSSFTSGVYMARIWSKNSLKTIRLIKE